MKMIKVFLVATIMLFTSAVKAQIALEDVPSLCESVAEVSVTISSFHPTPWKTINSKYLRMLMGANEVNRKAGLPYDRMRNTIQLTALSIAKNAYFNHKGFMVEDIRNLAYLECIKMFPNGVDK